MAKQKITRREFNRILTERSAIRGAEAVMTSPAGQVHVTVTKADRPGTDDEHAACRAICHRMLQEFDLDD